ncbi:MAG: hypothetical protein U0793_23405 [Gemmataceae bacterium]
MSLAPTCPAASGPVSTTERRLFLALLITAAAVLTGCLIYAVERYAAQPRRRFMESPAEVMMRALGVGHFLVGWIFLFTSPRLRTARAASSLLGWTALAALACVLYGQAGGAKQPLALFGFYTLFLIHEARDEYTLARAAGDIPAGSRFGSALFHAVTAWLIAILAATYLLRGAILDPARLPALPRGILAAGWTMSVLVAAALTWRAARVGTRDHGGWRAALRAHAPLVAVYRALLVLLVAGSFFGSIGFNLIILLHVGVWMAFMTQRLAVDGRDTRSWLRRPAGFLALHLGIAAVLLVLLALRVHVWERAGWFNQLLSATSFPYWSLMHIGMSFAKR